MRQFVFAFLIMGFVAKSQTITSTLQTSKEVQLSFDEYLGLVKKYHPLVKNADLEISRAQANLMMARGAFDPKIEVDFNQKKFKNKEYYSILNSSFKIPTWYGIEIKASFDNNDGVYLNPENTTPNQGLTSLGISVPLGQGLLINQRMADLQKAKIQIQVSKAERALEAISVLHNAAIAYFNWKKNYDELRLYQQYLSNAEKRFKGIQVLIKNGDKPAIDSTEAGIVVKNRLLSLEDAKLKLSKAKLELSNFLWLENTIPVELSDGMIPEEQLENTIQETLKTNELLQADFILTNHPKINSLERKIELLTIDKKVKSNMLLPKIDIGYSYLSEPRYFDNYQFKDYKVGLDFAFPIFLRKERGSLKLAKYKIQETEFILSLEKVQLTNKINAQKIEIVSLAKQRVIAKGLVLDNTTMLTSEERLFTFGESSLFLINTRENNLVSAQLAAITLENRFYISNSELFKIMANTN
ncbi:TolC family protein [Flavobacterium restrictum]|uniref:TolC family protein n=1 Tax=Flavobacterium restrictum TaxID=2594428 RepID=A0A553E408_9FLAO|nr:TolC family protein [Flavobacterium restrictum]TRX39672.1 TolC family protein [Flavobacterium restrictum]